MANHDLFRRHEATIRIAIAGTCARWRVHGADAEDLRSDLILCLLRDDDRVLRRFEGRSKLETYLFQVTIRVAYRWIRQRARRRRFEVPAGDTYATLCDVNRPEANGLQLRVLPQDAHRMIRGVLSTLRADEQFIIQCRAQGMTVSQIARTLGCSAKAAEYRLHRILSRLRTTLTSTTPATK